MPKYVSQPLFIFLRKRSLFFLLLLFICFKTNAQKIVILSQDKNNVCRNWLSETDSTLKIIDFYTLPKDSLQFYLLHSNGIIMTGGEDINPTLYGRPEYISICGVIDNYRDSLEVLLLKHAMNTQKPVLAICRGFQLMNVVNGGSLIPDIPTFIKYSTIKHKTKSGLHPINALKNSWIDKNFESSEFMVNSRHHQCIDRIARNFKVSAISPDGVIESIELKDEKDLRFIIGVQFHPESKDDELSHYLRAAFLKNLYSEK